MRNRTPTVVAVLAVVLIVAACASIPPDRAVLDTLQTIKAGAISSMTVIGNMYQAGQITEPQKAEAITIYNRLEAGCKAVAASASSVTTAQQGKDLTAPLQGLADQLKALLQSYIATGGVK